jgi:hypothetical protein
VKKPVIVVSLSVYYHYCNLPPQLAACALLVRTKYFISSNWDSSISIASTPGHGSLASSGIQPSGEQDRIGKSVAERSFPEEALRELSAKRALWTRLFLDSLNVGIEWRKRLAVLWSHE